MADTDGDFLLGDKPLKTLRLGQKIRARLLDDFRKQPRSTDPVARQWEKWLRGADPLLPVTFDHETAAAEPEGRLSQRPASPGQTGGAVPGTLPKPVQVSLIASTETVPPSEYPFALYQWRNVGVRSDETLVAVTSDPKLDGAVMSLLEVAVDEPAGTPPHEAAIERLDQRHHSQWRATRANHMENNRELVQHRRQSLNTSHRARCKLLEDQIGSATNDKIRRMKESRISARQL